MMIISKDLIPPYIPKKPRFIMLGTMASICSRHIEGYDNPNDPFYYHNPTRYFWCHLENIFNGCKIAPPYNKCVADKKKLCEDLGIALCNIVTSMKIDKKDAQCARDDIIFKAQEVKIKKVLSEEFKDSLRNLPVFFTRKTKPRKLMLLLERFYEENDIDTELIKKINFIRTPAFYNANTKAEWEKYFQCRGLLSR